MAVKALPSQEVLRQLLRYEEETGRLFWLSRSAGMVSSTDPRGAQWLGTLILQGVKLLQHQTLVDTDTGRCLE
jgi:hypothetical protein